MKTNEQDLQELIEKCFEELSVAYKEKYDQEKAERTAAMFLAAQMKLGMIISDYELAARHSKNEIERVMGDKYFEIKNGWGDKKITEMALAQNVAKDEDVIKAKRACAENEAVLKKYVYLMNSLKDGHIFFRGIAKGKNSWE